MKQIKNKNIPLRGIERNTNDISVKDGACDEIINMRFKDGAWRPLGGKTPNVRDITQIAGYESFTDIYKHNVLDQGLFIAKNGSDIILLELEEYISVTAKTIDASQSSTDFVITTHIIGDFTISDNRSWITLSKESGNGIDTVTVTVSAATTSERTGKVTFTADSGTFECNITAEGLTISAISEVETHKQAQDIEIDVTILPIDAEFVTVETPNETWITALVDDQVNDKVTVSLSENTTGSPREGTIKISHADFPSVYAEVDITQLETAIVANPDSHIWASGDYHEAKVSNITIDPDVAMTLIKTGDTSKFDVVKDDTLNTITITNLETNLGSEDYVMTIEIRMSGYLSEYITCTQYGAM